MPKRKIIFPYVNRQRERSVMFFYPAWSLSIVRAWPWLIPLPAAISVWTPLFIRYPRLVSLQHIKQNTHPHTKTPIFTPLWHRHSAATLLLSYYTFGCEYFIHSRSVVYPLHGADYRLASKQQANQNKNVSVKCYTLSTFHSSPLWMGAQMQIIASHHPWNPPEGK